MINDVLVDYSSMHVDFLKLLSGDVCRSSNHLVSSRLTLFLQFILNVCSNLPPAILKEKTLLKHGLFDLNHVLNHVFIYLGIMCYV